MALIRFIRSDDVDMDSQTKKKKRSKCPARDIIKTIITVITVITLIASSLITFTPADILTAARS